MPKKFFPRKRLYKKRTAARKPAARKTRMAPIKRLVKSMIHKQLENKVEQVTLNYNFVSSYAYNTSLFCMSMIPYTQITQGLGQGDRIGNTIRPRSVYFNYVLYPTPYSAVLNPQPTPQDVMIFFGKVKNSRAQQPIASDFAKLWQSGDTSRSPFSTTLDMLQDVNKDWFTVYKIMRHKVGTGNYNGTGTQAAYQHFTNNDYKYNVVRRLNITKYVPKVIKFNDTTAQNTNDGLWMWAMSVNANGTVNSSSAPLYMDVTLNFSYEDA